MSNDANSELLSDILNQDIIGLDSCLDVYTGYDEVCAEASTTVYRSDADSILTKEEKIKLADIMIARWMEYKEKAS